MDRTLIENAYAGLRVALGAGLALVPGAARPWIGGVAGDRDVRSALRVLGVRDALLGVAVLSAAGDGRVRRRMLLLCAIADTGDALVSGVDFLRTRRAGAALAALAGLGGAAVGFSAAGNAIGGRSVVQ